MTKFTGKNLTFSFNGVAISGLTSLETNEQVDVYTASVAGDSYKSRATGLTDAQFTLSFLVDTTTFGTIIPALAPGSTGAMVGTTNGTFGPQYSAASSYVESLAVSAPVEGFVAGTAVIGVDGALVTA